MIKKALASITIAGVAVVGSATAASAHFCYLTNAAEQNAVAAQRSGSWLGLPEIFTVVFNVPADKVDAAVNQAVTAGVPANFAIFERATLKSTKSGSIQHIFDGPYLIPIVGAALANGGTPPPMH